MSIILYAIYMFHHTIKSYTNSFEKKNKTITEKGKAKLKTKMKTQKRNRNRNSMQQEITITLKIFRSIFLVLINFFLIFFFFGSPISKYTIISQTCRFSCRRQEIVLSVCVFISKVYEVDFFFQNNREISRDC